MSSPVQAYTLAQLPFLVVMMMMMVMVMMMIVMMTVMMMLNMCFKYGLFGS